MANRSEDALIIGKGGEGKSRIGRSQKEYLVIILNSGSLQKLENKNTTKSS